QLVGALELDERAAKVVLVVEHSTFLEVLLRLVEPGIRACATRDQARGQQESVGHCAHGFRSMVGLEMARSRTSRSSGRLSSSSIETSVSIDCFGGVMGGSALGFGNRATSPITLPATGERCQDAG